MARIQLRDLCGVRCGDKGDISDLSLFADTEAAYEAIKDEVTAARVKEHFGWMVSGEVVRYEARNVLALKFVMHGALGGGAPRSLRSDNLGKTHGPSLLRMWVDVPDDVAASAAGAVLRSLARKRVSFFEKNRKALEERGVDPARLPPGQYFTERFPVLHAGSVPDYPPDLAGWTFRVFGAVDNPFTLTWTELRALPAVDVTVDIHCVTKWSKFDTVWRGVPVTTVLEQAGLRPEASHVMAHAEFGYTANVPLADLTGERVALLAYQYDGKPLDPEHGWPLRLFVPHLYFWKSAKWLTGLELMTNDQPGFWERNGYHNDADPFLEQRHWGD